MALIKCKDCKKEISDKAENCIYCGCPVEKVYNCSECGNIIDKNSKFCEKCGCPVEIKKEHKLPKNLFAKIWLMLCILACLLISWITFANVFTVAEEFIVFEEINIMGVLAIVLGLSYAVLLITFSKESFCFLLGINLVILVLNISHLQFAINLIYIICVFLNSIITFFVVRKILKKQKFSIIKYLPTFIVIILAIALPFLLNLISYKDIQSNERDYNVRQIEIVTDYINIRANKSINSEILGEVYYGEIFTVISEDEESKFNWYEIETNHGIRGYIAGKNNGADYVVELEVADISNNLEDEENVETNSSINTDKNNTNKNESSNKPNKNETTTQKPEKTCDYSAKEKLTREYENTLSERESEYNTNYADAKKKVDLAKEALDTTGGYLSKEQYNELYNAANSTIEKKLIQNRYDMSVTYDKMVKVLNDLPAEFNKWKDTYKAWYSDELSKIGC